LLAVYADPKCGYCKKSKRDLQLVKNIIVYTFLYPIVGGDSPEKSKQIRCGKDTTKIWRGRDHQGSGHTAALQPNFPFG
jgi:thiol:disulfide interchange protein DsbC